MSKLRFFHIRNYDIDGSTAAKGGTTVALLNPPDVSNIMSGSKLALSVGLALCHEDDNYNKKIGRDIATGRIKEVEFTLLVDFTEENDRYFRLIGEESLYFAKSKNGNLIVTSACQKR